MAVMLFATGSNGGGLSNGLCNGSMWGAPNKKTLGYHSGSGIDLLAMEQVALAVIAIVVVAYMW